MKLEEILKSQGMTDEQVKKTVEEMKQNKIFIAGEENLDIRFGKLKTDHDTLSGQHKEAQTLIEQLKKGTTDNEELQGKITSYETQVATLQTELEQAKLESAIKVALLSEKAVDVDYMAFKLKEKGELKLDDKGNVKGIDDLITGLKTQYPTQFEKVSGGGKYEERRLDKPDDGGSEELTKERFDKMGYQDRLKLFNEQPDVYKTLSGTENE